MILMKMMKLMKKLLMKRNKVLMKGAIAQLGERYTGSVEVSGSNPLPRTSDVAQWLARPAHNREVRGSIPLIASKASLSVKYG